MEASVTQKTAILSTETLAFIAQKAAEIHHGEIRLEINADRPQMVTIQVIQNERFPAVSHKG